MVQIQTSYLYKVFRSGTYLGLLKNVTSPFTFSQQINTAGASLDITAIIDPDSALQAVEQLTDEVGHPLTDESGNALFPDAMPPQFGENGDGILYQEGNDVQVWETSQYYPNGHQVFAGRVSRWQNNDGSDNTIQLTVLSYGADFANYLITGDETIDQSQTYFDPTLILEAGPQFGGIYKVGQTWKTGVATTNISAVGLMLQALSGNGVTSQLFVSVNVTVTIYSDPSSGMALGSATVNTITAQNFNLYKFVFGSPLTLSPSTVYYMEVSATANISNSVVGVGFTNGNDFYANGSAYWGNQTSPPLTNESFEDIYFITLFQASVVNAPYIDQDPRDILVDITSDYTAQGGLVTCNPSHLVTTGVRASQQFKVNTVLEGIQTCLSFAPYNWYWYVDVATNNLYSKPESTVADFVFVKGRHYTTLDLLRTTETIKNSVYLTGGQTSSGENIFVHFQDDDSIAAYGVGLDRLSDTRILDIPTAQAVAQSYVDRWKNPQYQTTMTILATTCDTSQFKPGWMIGFAGNGDFRDQLLLQCVSITPSPDGIQLQLGSLPKRASKQIDEINRALTAQQVLDNPPVAS